MDLTSMIGMFGDQVEEDARTSFRQKHANDILDDIYVVERMLQDTLHHFSNEYPDLKFVIIEKAFFRAFGHRAKHVMLGIKAKTDEDMLTYYETYPNNIASLHVTAETYRDNNWIMPRFVLGEIDGFIQAQLEGNTML